MPRKFKRWAQQTVGTAASALVLYVLGHVFSGTKNYLGAKVEPLIATISPTLDRYLYDGPPVLVPPKGTAQAQSKMETGSLQSRLDDKHAPASEPSSIASVEKRTSRAIIRRDPVTEFAMAIGRASEAMVGLDTYRDDRPRPN